VGRRELRTPRRYLHRNVNVCPLWLLQLPSPLVVSHNAFLTGIQPKPAAATKPAATPAAPAPAPSPAPTPAPAPAAAAPAAAAAAPAAAAPNADHVRQLTEMGFPEDQATAALRAAQGNPDVAVEFLMTGIPDNIQVHGEHLLNFTTAFVRRLPRFLMAFLRRESKPAS